MARSKSATEVATPEREKARQDQDFDDSLLAAIRAMSWSEYAKLNDFIKLSTQIKQKQDALDIMAADTTPAAILSAYVADILEPNSQGDLINIVANDSNNQPVLDYLYKSFNFNLEKIVYSLLKNAIVIGEFAREADLPTNKSKQMPATEDIKMAVPHSKLAPKLKIISDTTRVFPILQYEEVVGFVEITLTDLSNVDYGETVFNYKDVVLHPASDYVYVKFGFRPESAPLTLKIKNDDGTTTEYEIDQGRSLLEQSYPAWQTLSIMKSSINLARLSHSNSSIVVTTEVGNTSEAQIELARNKLKDLFENRLAIGNNGIQTYLQPQIRPNYIYVFTKNGKGAISTETIGGDYNPGVLTDLNYFEDEFFGGMNAVKQYFARTEDSGGLDGGGAIEQYKKRWDSTVAQFKRLLGTFIKKAINQVILSRGILGIYEAFDVRVDRAFAEEENNVVNHQQAKLALMEQAINFLGIDDPDKLRELKLQALKTVITDKALLEAFNEAVSTSPKPKQAQNTEGAEDSGDSGLGGLGGGGGDLMSQIDSLGTPDENLDTTLPEGGETGEGETSSEGGAENPDLEGGINEESGELPAVGDVVDASQIDEET